MKKHLLSMPNEARKWSLLLLFVLLMSAASAWAGQFTKTYEYFWQDTQSYDWKNYFCADATKELGFTMGTITEVTIYSPKTYYRVSSVKVSAGVVAAAADFDDANVTISVNGQTAQTMTVTPSSQYPGNAFSQLNTLATQEYTFSFADAPLENQEVAITITNKTTPQYGDNGGIDLYVKSVTVTYESNVTVGGVAVTEENMSGITGTNIEGTVTYDGDTNTLTLTSANIKSGGVQADDDLTIVAIGSPNYINGSVTTTKQDATLTFKSGGDADAALQLNLSSSNTQSGFATVSYDGLYLTADNDRDTKYSSQRQRFEYSEYAQPTTVKLSSARTYELWVGGTKVTDANKDGITSDFLTATESGKEFAVTYDPDAHKLTLKNVTLSGSGINNYGIISRLPSLTIYLDGANEIICNDSCTAIRADADIDQSLTFDYWWLADDYSLAFKAPRAVRDFIEVTTDGIYWNNNYEYHSGKVVDSYGTEVTDKSVVLSNTEYYGLSVGGVDVTSQNFADITGGAIVSGKYSYDSYNKVLTIDGSDSPAVISSTTEYGILNKKLASLTVKVKGKCTIDMSESEETNPIFSTYTNANWQPLASLTFVRDEDYAGTSSLTLKSNGGMEKNVITNFASVDVSNFAAMSATGAAIQVGYVENALWELDAEGGQANYVTDVTLVPAYNLWVNGEQVTDNNKGAVLANYILSGSSIQFNSLSKTLTLNKVDGVVFDTTVPFIKNGLGNMTIHIVGENELSCGRLFLTQPGEGESTYDVTFTTDPASPGSLIVVNSSDEGGAWYTGHTLTFRNELDMDVTEWTEETRRNVATIQVPSGLTTYGLVVGGVTVTPDNAANIANGNDWIVVEDGGQLSFDPESNTLTMKDVTIGMPIPTGAPYPAIVTGLDRLTVSISGSNSIWFNRAEGDYSSASETFAFQAANANAELVFTKASVDENATLSLSTSKPAFDGFKSVTYENGLLYDKNNMVVKGLEIPYPYAYYNSSEEALEVGMEYAPVDGVTVYYSIDYADESKQDVENAVYDGNATLFISSPCTFTTYAQYGEYTSAVSKAKAFAFEESEVTVRYGVDATVNAPALVPAIEDADQISVQYGEYVEAVAPAYEPASGNTDAVATIDESTGVMTINKPGTIRFAAYCSSEVVSCWGLGESEKPAFDLTVNDVEHGIVIRKGDVDVSVTNYNLSDVLGDGTDAKPASVQYDGHSRLVLNNATLKGIIVGTTNNLPESGLEIYLEGASTITNNDDYAVKYEGTDVLLKLTFLTGGDAPGMLTYTSGSDTPETVFANMNVNFRNKLARTTEANVTTVRTPLQLIVDEVASTAQTTTTSISYSEPAPGDEPVTTNALKNLIVRNVLYTLNDLGTAESPDGYDQTKKLLVINSTMTDAQVQQVHEKVMSGECHPSLPSMGGQPSFEDYFRGLTFMVPAGEGVIGINSETAEGFEFHLKIGGQPAIKVKKTNITYFIHYSVTENTFVYLYLVATGTSAPAYARSNDGRRIGPKSTVSGGLGGLNVSSNSISSAPDAGASYLMMCASDYGTSGNYGIKVNNADVTDLPDGAFAAVMPVSPAPRRAVDANMKTFIDVSSTKITGKSFSRTEGAFKDVPEETIIYLPAGNTAVGKNFVIGGICENLELKATRENPFEAAADFTAAVATFDREFTEGEVGTEKKCYTIFLPYALNIEEVDGELWEYTGYDSANETVKMTQVVATSDNQGWTTPNKVYFFKPSKTGALKPMLSTQVKKFTGAVAEPGNESEAEGMHGVYEYYKWTTKPSNVYCYSASDKDGIVAGEFAKVGVDTYIKPFRAYLRLNASTAPEFISISWGDGTTSIVPLDKEQVHQDADGWYTITGFRLPSKPTEKGIYIHNHKKIVVK